MKRKLFKVIFLALKGFGKDHGALWATALTYTTVFATVPLLAVAFSIFHAVGGLRSLEELVKPYILRMIVPGAQEKVIALIGSTIDSIDAGTIGIVGSGALLITSLLLLCEIEISLNNIWGIKADRPPLHRVAIYWICITIGPLFLATASLITVALTNTRLAQAIEAYVNMDLLSLLPYVFIWVAFVGLYLFMPNTRVKFKSALVGGMIGGTLWQIVGLGFSIYTSKVVVYSSIYGSLGVIPLFLFWIFLSWFLFLLGAEICFYHQNISYYKDGAKEEDLCQWERNFLTLRVLLYLGSEFYHGRDPRSLQEISRETRISAVLIKSILKPLIGTGVVIEIKDEELVYLLGRKLDRVRIRDLIECFRDGLQPQPDFAGDRGGKYILRLMERGEVAFNEGIGDWNLKEVIEEFEREDLGEGPR